MSRTSWIFITLIIIFLSACTPAPRSDPAALATPAAGTASITSATPTSRTSGLRTPLNPQAAVTTLLPTTPVVPKTRTVTATASSTRPADSTPVPETSNLVLQSCLKQGGRIETGSLKTSLLRLPLVYRVYLPPCYDQQPKQRYPVLYLFHGQSFSDDQWDRMGADETADRLIAAGEIPPFLIVMPYERYGGQPTETRFDQAFMDVLLPYIEETYRTVPDRQHRAAGGLSRGAGWAVHFGIWKAAYFSAVGAHSPAVFHTDAQRMRTWLKGLSPNRFPRIYVDIGERDRPEIMRSALWFAELLDEFEVPHEWHLFTGYHNEAYWSSHMEQYLRWYSQDW